MIIILVNSLHLLICFSSFFCLHMLSIQMNRTLNCLHISLTFNLKIYVHFHRKLLLYFLHIIQDILVDYFLNITQKVQVSVRLVKLQSPVYLFMALFQLFYCQLKLFLVFPLHHQNSCFTAHFLFFIDFFSSWVLSFTEHLVQSQILS